MTRGSMKFPRLCADKQTPVRQSFREVSEPNAPTACKICRDRWRGSIEVKFNRTFLGVLAAIASACSTVVQPTGNATVTIATPLTPANGAQIPNAAQPVTLTV